MIVQVVGSTLVIPVSAVSKLYLLWFLPGCARKALSIYSAYRLLLDVFPPDITLSCFNSLACYLINFTEHNSSWLIMVDVKEDPYKWPAHPKWYTRLAKPGRGMYYDVRRRLPYYVSDWRDGCKSSTRNDLVSIQKEHFQHWLHCSSSPINDNPPASQISFNAALSCLT